MPERYKQPVVSGVTRFTNAPVSEIETSRMVSPCYVTTTFNGGDIVPVRAIEVLPRETYSIDVEATIRQLTMVAPTMDSLEVDIYAFFVPHRIVNESWKAVQGENYTGAWVAPEVSLVPLLREGAADVQVPVGSVADHYDFPTQMPIPAEVLQQCNDLVFRGYLETYNVFFRNENYQPSIPYSKLNIYEGFFEPVSVSTSVSPDPSATSLGQPVNYGPSVTPDGSPGAGAIAHAVLGSGGSYSSAGGSTVYGRAIFASSWTALSAPLKANKRMDYFTSCLPSPQKGPAVTFSLSGTAPVITSSESHEVTVPVRFGRTGGYHKLGHLFFRPDNEDGDLQVADMQGLGSSVAAPAVATAVTSLNLVTDLGDLSVTSVSELRDAIAIQQVYEQLARGGSRYREFINSFFGLDVEDPFSDIPVYLGHIRRGLDQYQTAQTAPPTTEGGKPLATLAAFGYTNTSGKLFGPYTAKEHGYIHILAVVRHRNVYSSFMSRDKFRLKSLDWYNPILANLSEQPVYTRELNPFAPDPEGVVGYQEAWAEYRMDPDTVSGLMRPGVDGTLSIWNYADDFDSGLTIVDGDWLKSNTAQVVARTTATSEASQPQFKARFALRIDRIFPGPTYSVPGLDIV